VILVSSRLAQVPSELQIFFGVENGESREVRASLLVPFKVHVRGFDELGGSAWCPL